MSKNVLWIGAAVIAAMIGALFGPALLSGFSPDTVLTMLGVLLVAIIGYVLWALSSNRGAKSAGAGAIADARAMRPMNGMARIYIVRRGLVAAMQGVDITIENVASGQIKSGQQLMAEVPPGHYRIHAGTAKKSLAKPADTELVVSAGEVAVISAMFEMGALKGSIKLARLDEGNGKADIAATRLMLWETA